MTLLTEGSKVTYVSQMITRAKNKHGIIKDFSVDPRFAFVVFHCAGEWENYENYTAVRTPVKKLKPGWI